MLAELFRMLTDDAFDNLLIGDIGDIGSEQVLAVAQNGDSVGDLANLIHTMGDVDQRDAFVLEMPHQIEESFRFRGAQRGRGFIENQHPGIGAQRFGDFRQLPVSRCQCSHFNIRVEVDAQSVQKLLRLLAHAFLVQKMAAIQRLRAHEDVLRDAHCGDEGEFLEHHADSRLACGLD